MKAWPVAAVLALAACTKGTPPAAPKPDKNFVPPQPPALPAKVDPPGSPEAAYRAFWIAQLEGTEAAIRPLVLDAPDVAAIWKEGPFAPDLKKMLANQYGAMDITRVGETPDRVTLQAMCSPIPLTMVREGKTWKLDAAPIIAIRKAAGP